MKIKPLANKILVQEITRTTTTNGGIHLPDYTHHDRPKEFRVLQTGPKVHDVKPGDRLICHSHFTGPVELGGGRHIITEDQILAFFPAPEAVHIP